MNSALADMKSNLASTKYKTNTLIQKTLEIQKEINNVTNKRDIVTAVIDKLVIVTINCCGKKFGYIN